MYDTINFKLTAEDVCNIDLEKLREYASDWNYEEREED